MCTITETNFVGNYPVGIQIDNGTDKILFFLETKICNIADLNLIRSIGLKLSLHEIFAFTGLISILFLCAGTNATQTHFPHQLTDKSLRYRDSTFL